MDGTIAERNKFYSQEFIIYGDRHHWIINYDTYAYI